MKDKQFMVGNGTNKDSEEDKNTFHSTKKFLRLLLVSKIYMLIVSGIQVFSVAKNFSPQIAGINTVLIPMQFTIFRKISNMK